MDGTRLDKWLWAARFFKTRALSQEAIERGRVTVAGAQVKASREVRIGELLLITQGSGASSLSREVKVLALSSMRGSASVAQGLYEESAQSLAKRQQQAEAKALSPTPGADLRGRPTKRERRDLDSIKLKFGGGKFDW